MVEQRRVKGEKERGWGGGEGVRRMEKGSNERWRVRGRKGRREDERNR